MHPFLPDKVIPVFDTDFVAVAEALKAGSLSGKAEIVERYESALAEEFGAGQAVAVSSGTMALQAALHANGVRAGSDVMVSALAPPPTVMPLLTLGANPVFVDCLPDSFDFDLADLRRAVTPMTRALLIVHLWGYPTAIAEAAAIAADLDLPIIEDAAQAHYSLTDRGRYAGASAEVGCFSTQERKLLSTGEGGFVLTGDAEMAERVRAYIRIGGPGGNRYGVNGKLPALSAALGRSRLPHARQEASLRKARLNELAAALGDGGVRHMPCSGGAVPNGYAMVLLSPTEAIGKAFDGQLEAKGIPSETRLYSACVAYRKEVFRKWARPCPNAESLIGRLATVPVHSGLTNGDLEVIRKALSRAGAPTAPTA